MPMRKTPEGLIKIGGTKSFNEIQTENAAALKAKLVETVTCGVEAVTTSKVAAPAPTSISTSTLVTVSAPAPVIKTPSLEKVKK